ncbi:MAG: hypothetical protein D6804_02335, partial [Aquificota bacterium]
TVKLWDVNTGREVRTFIGRRYIVWSVSFSPDGRYIASGSYDNTVKLWDVNTGREVRTFIGRRYIVWSVSFSPDGRYIASGNWWTVELWGVYLLALEWRPPEWKAPEKDPFETTKEYEARVQRSREEYQRTVLKMQEEFKQRVSAFQMPYSKEITLKPENYSADAGRFEIELYGQRLFIPAPREKAKEMVKRPVRLTGTLRYYDDKNLILTEASVIDDATNERYPIFQVAQP